MFIISLLSWYKPTEGGNPLSSTPGPIAELAFSSSSRQSILVSSSDFRQPPPTSYHHVIYYVTPASQSGRCLLPIKVFPLPQATFTILVPGQEKRFAFHVPLNHTHSHTHNYFPLFRLWEVEKGTAL
ncbi:hypothetical protein TNCV_923581 [Trichonephila clavipes]|nr:hypothetical protein TNCV_923581 [Trichonephila clavipes]